MATEIKPGNPVQFYPDFIPARGPEVEVTVVWKNDQGKTVRARGQEMVHNVIKKQAMQEPWVFVGSQFVKYDDGQEYYLADGFYLGGGFIIGGGFGDLYSGSTMNISPIQINLGYVVPLETVLPYVGFGTGPMFTVPDEGDAAVSLSMTFGAGILVPLNYHVALQIGLHPTVLIGLSNFQGTVFSMPFGAIGIRGFF